MSCKRSPSYYPIRLNLTNRLLPVRGSICHTSPHEDGWGLPRLHLLAFCSRTLCPFKKGRRVNPESPGLFVRESGSKAPTNVAAGAPIRLHEEGMTKRPADGRRRFVKLRRIGQ
ncbi:hypothetical protein CEXT_221391 [Caerostris extrusa]|uniref:Uncharacterized protein n=1 Tax=Caerostris extrusa TaxID=172846 RepID=A0AAV4U916_CAEEX|nr:hypothetical protein CEXT_221391 [Caerostris extrusa]